MTEQRIAGLAEQIEFARAYRQQWPEWLRSMAHFSGSNHPEDLRSEEGSAQAQTGLGSDVPHP